MTDNKTKAEILLQALPYIKKYFGQTLVIKYGGDAMKTDALICSCMKDIVLLQQIGIKVVLVHGGAPQVNAELAKQNIAEKFLNGVRVVSAETMKLIENVVSGNVNKKLVKEIGLAGGTAFGMSGVDGNMITAEALGEEYGFAGKIVKIDTKPITVVLSAGYVPVISPVGYDKDGNLFSIDADDVATAVAGALNAACLINMTDVSGVLSDKNDATSLIPVVNVSEVPLLIKAGTIEGVMVKKVKTCVEAIRRGVKSVFIIDGTVEHSVLIEILSDQGIGTMFV